MSGRENLPMIPRQRIYSLSELFPELNKNKDQRKEWEIAPVIDSACFKYENDRIAILPKTKLM